MYIDCEKNELEFFQFMLVLEPLAPGIDATGFSYAFSFQQNNLSLGLVSVNLFYTFIIVVIVVILVTCFLETFLFHLSL